jgi:hypothetical protein
MYPRLLEIELMIRGLVLSIYLDLLLMSRPVKEKKEEKEKLMSNGSSPKH